MPLSQIGILLAVAAIVGGVAQALFGKSGAGFIASTVVGFFGSFVGVWLARTFGLPLILTVGVGGGKFPIVWAILGGALFVAITNMLMSRPSRA